MLPVLTERGDSLVPARNGRGTSRTGPSGRRPGDRRVAGFPRIRPLPRGRARGYPGISPRQAGGTNTCGSSVAARPGHAVVAIAGRPGVPLPVDGSTQRSGPQAPGNLAPAASARQYGAPAGQPPAGGLAAVAFEETERELTALVQRTAGAPEETE
jgi:hypothetical protein